MEKRCNAGAFAVGPRRVLAAMALLIASAACSVSDDIRRADEGVSRFHALFNASQDHQIYLEADGDFKRVTVESDWQTLLDRVRTRLGRAARADRNGANVVEAQGTVTVVVTYETSFTNGTATEEFTFVLQSDHATLRGYRIASPLLSQQSSHCVRAGPIRTTDDARACDRVALRRGA